MDFLGQIEKLAYSLAIWVILIPKTIVKIITDPVWVRGYIAKEFEESAAAEKAGKSGDKVRFDDYISPVILLLLCSLVPYLGLQFLPDFGFAFNGGESIQGKASCTANVDCTYKVQAYILGDAAGDFVEWQCRDEPYTDTSAFRGASLKDESYPIASQATCKWTAPGTVQVYAAIKDEFGGVINWTTRDVEVKASSATSAAPAEPEPSTENAIADNTAKAKAQADKAKGIADAVKQNSYLGVIFLLPALAFAVVTHGIRRDDKKEIQLSAESLKEVFYAQCYYFTPISLATYALIYASYFMTPDDVWTLGLLAIVLLIMAFWFYRVEVHAVKHERQFQHRKDARKIVNWTIFGTVTVTLVGLILFTSPETLRSWSYRLVEWGILIAFLYPLVIRRMVKWWRNRKNKKETQPSIPQPS